MNGNIIQAQITGFLIGACFLFGISHTVDAVIDEDWIVIAAYMFSGQLGLYIGMKIKVDKKNRNHKPIKH